MNSHQSRSSSLKLGSPMLIRGRNSPRSWLIPGLQLSTQAGDGGQARLHLEALHGAVHTQEELVEVAGQQFSVSVSVRYQNIARPRLTYVLPLLRMFLSIKWSRLPSARPASQTLYRVHRDLKLSILAFPTEYKRLRRVADQTEARCSVPASTGTRRRLGRTIHP